MNNHLREKSVSPGDQTCVETPVAHATTTGMTGGGFYDANSAPQWKAIEAVLPWLDEAVANLPLSGVGPVTLADFGCSEGRNSIAVMSRALETLLPLTDRPVQTIHSDLPTNDFSKLFLNLRPEGCPVYQSDRVYSSAVGGSMFDQLLPPASVHLATTFNAIGFLSSRPVKYLPGYILPNGPCTLNDNGYVSEDDRQTFSELAKGDVACFLRARAKELVPGGKLLVQVFGSTDTARTCDGIYDLLNDAVLGFVESGDITRDTYEAYYQPVYMRQLDELTAAISDDAYGASGLFSLDHSKAYEVAVPFNQQYRNDGDTKQYAEDYVNFFRAFTEAVLHNALPEQPDRVDLVNRIYARAKVLLEKTPERYPFRYAAVAMLLTRKG
jgi:gibberellin A4 carboxyl methyltransferase